MNVGEPFNPWRGACGFYPPDAVSALGRLSIIGTGRKLGDAHKLLYTLLVRRAGRDGLCFPGLKALAVDLGKKSLRSVKMLIDDLEAFGLIALRRRGDGQRGEFTFRWHAIFAAVQRCKNGDSEVQEPALQRCKSGRPLYREEARTGETRTGKQAELPPPTITHPAGRVEPNPEYRRVVEVLRKAAPRIRRADNPVAYERAIIRGEMAGRVSMPNTSPEADGLLPTHEASPDERSTTTDVEIAAATDALVIEESSDRGGAARAVAAVAPELSLEDRRLLAEARKLYPFGSRENLMEAVAEMRAKKARAVEESVAEVVEQPVASPESPAPLSTAGVEERIEALKAESARLKAEHEELLMLEKYWAARALRARAPAAAVPPVGFVRSMKGGVIFPVSGFMDSLAG